MRRSRNTEFLINDDGVIGIFMDADFVAEHEQGIGDMLRSFDALRPLNKLLDEHTEKKFINLIKGKLNSSKIEDAPLGIARRTVGCVPENLIFSECHEKKKLTGYALSFGLNKADISHILRFRGGELITSAWDQYGFAILVRPELKEMLETLYQSFKNKDIAIILGGGSFLNAGLNIVIASKMPQEEKDNLLKADLDYLELQKAVKTSGIIQELERAGLGKFKGYYALRPQWKDSEKNELLFLLNPCNQNSCNFGYYSINDLRLWIKGRGPIIKAREAN